MRDYVALAAWADSVRGLPFRWGVTDCASLAIAAVDTLRGNHRAADYFYAPGRFPYTRRAARLVQAERFHPRHLGAIGLTRATTTAVGDVLIVRRARGWICAHVVLGRIAVSSSFARGVQVVDVPALLALPRCETWSGR